MFEQHVVHETSTMASRFAAKRKALYQAAIKWVAAAKTRAQPDNALSEGIGGALNG